MTHTPDDPRVSAFHLDLVAINPAHEQLRSSPVRVLVDTGAELSWLPAEALERIGVQRRRTRVFRSADGREIDRHIGYCIVEAGGFATVDEVVFAQAGDLHFVGVRTLEGSRIVVDRIAHRRIATGTLVAAA